MYTKGDWKLNPLPNPTQPKYYCLYTKEGDHTTINHICQITDNGLNDKNEMHANALLLAAAPSMYEALQDMVKKYERERGLTHINDLHPEYSKAIAALKKAQGR